MNEKILEEYSVKIYEMNPYFYDHYKEKIKADKNECEYILFRIDVYFTEYVLAVEINEQNHKGRELSFEKKKRQEALEKNMAGNLLELIQVMQKRVMIQIMKLVKYNHFLVNLKKKKERKRKQNKRTRRQNKKN